MDQELSQQLCEAGLAALVVVDREHRLTAVNDEARRLLGLDAGAPLPTMPYGSPDWPVYSVDGARLSATDLPAEQVFLHGTVEERTVRQPAAPGVPARVLHLRAAPLRGRAGRIDAVGYALSDRTRETALDGERLRLLQIMEATPDYIILADADQDVMYVNPAARALTSGSADRPGPAHLSELVAPDPEEDGAGGFWQRALAEARTEGYWRGESGFRAAEGRVVEVLLTVLAHPVGTPHVEYYTVFGRDISQRRRLESELRDERGLHEAIVDGLPGIYYFLNERGHLLRWNRNLERVTGYSAEELARMNGIELWAAEEHDRVRQSTRDAHRDGSGQIEARLVTRTGREIPYLLTGTRMIREGRTFLTAFGTDISERRQMEERLRSSAEVFEQIREAVVIADRDLNVLQTNKAFDERTRGGYRDPPGLERIFMETARADPERHRAMWETLRKTGMWSGEVVIPVADGSGLDQWLTLSEVRDGRGRTVRYIAVFSDITELKRSRERLAYQANHDALTGLPNRALFRSQVERAMSRAARPNGMVAVAFLDLDRFRDINNSLGHEAGDQLLVQLARRLQHAVRSGDTVARVGANQFGICVEQARSVQGACQQVSRLMNLLEEPVEVAGQALQCTGSAGLSTYPRDARNVDALLRHADTAMHDAKAAGRNTVRCYTDELTRRAARRLELAQQLRRGIAEDRFLLHYQTQFDLGTGRVSGVEALVRYRHPEEGVLGPGQFIPVAEEAGLICELGEWILHAACAQGREWLDAGRGFGRVAVNISAQQVEDGGLAATVESALSRSGLPAQHLELEITESAFMAFTDSILESLQKIRSLGVKLAVDDFGTGYSSLLYLKRLPVQRLKIDRGFVHDMQSSPESRGIVHTIVGLARNLELDLVAEGVETEGQAVMLRSFLPIVGQGFLWSRPVPDPVLPAGAIRAHRA